MFDPVLSHLLWVSFLRGLREQGGAMAMPSEISTRLMRSKTPWRQPSFCDQHSIDFGRAGFRKSGRW